MVLRKSSSTTTSSRNSSGNSMTGSSPSRPLSVVMPLPELQQQMPMTRNLADEDAEQDSSTTPFFDCAFDISNDYEEEDTLTRGDVCGFPKSYGLCDWQESSATTMGRLEQWVIPYNYEVYFAGVFQPPLDFLQGLLLQELASQEQVENCSQGRTRTMRRTLQDSSTTNSTATVVAMTYDPVDVVDYQDPCQAPVEQSIRQQSTCVKVLGQITAVVEWKGNADEATQLAISSRLLLRIRDLMGNDQLVAKSQDGSISKVIFLGQRQDLSYEGTTDYQHPTTDSVTSSSTNQVQSTPPLSGVGIAFLVILGLTFMLCCGCCWMRWRSSSSKRQQQQQSLPEEGEINFEHETTSKNEDDQAMMKMEQAHDSTTTKPTKVVQDEESTLPHPCSGSISSNEESQVIFLGDVVSTHNTNNNAETKAANAENCPTTEEIIQDLNAGITADSNNDLEQQRQEEEEQQSPSPDHTILETLSEPDLLACWDDETDGSRDDQQLLQVTQTEEYNMTTMMAATDAAPTKDEEQDTIVL